MLLSCCRPGKFLLLESGAFEARRQCSGNDGSLLLPPKGISKMYTSKVHAHQKVWCLYPLCLYKNKNNRTEQRRRTTLSFSNLHILLDFLIWTTHQCPRHFQKTRVSCPCTPFLQNCQKELTLGAIV
jgi:hypothetical protein